MFNLFKTKISPASDGHCCDGCRKVRVQEMLATCPKCGKLYCSECGRTDHILQYQSKATNQTILSAVVCCPTDGGLLEKFRSDPYISHLRDLEKLHWDALTVDPKSELAGTVTWSEAHTRLAKRYIAVGMTFHSNPVLTFGVFGGLHRFLTGQDGDAYLQRCALDYREKGFELEKARVLMVELGISMGATPGDREHTQALIIARQFIRTAGLT